MIEWKSIHHDSIHTADISPGWHIEITSTHDGWWLHWVENEARMTLQALGKEEEETNDSSL